ncbi:hypothetical protein [Flavobacterium sp. DG2-3]|uniref:hypothetical protein n=1 Tax=Flavobacterium sp. DG2-3 TaxID=3068317 RepID=UPI00273F7771|nr:hypothetical protein [Flavobacterium sp. DG2-3]MDP5202003.1 hypothetical protein [Flavobacterium sp. DG2-3]
MEFEKSVMTEIFPSLIDSTCMDTRLFTNFPPEYGESIFDKTGHYVGVDSTKATKEQKQKLLEWKINTEKIKKDTSKIVIAFDPVIEYSREDLTEYLQKHFKNIKPFIQKEKVYNEFILDFKNIKLKNRFELRHISQFPKERGMIWLAKYNFNFSGAVSFTRIQFDQNKKFGVFNGYFGCGGRCGQSFRIYIKKAGDKWIIDNVEITAIA